MSTDRLLLYLKEMDVAAARIRDFIQDMDEAAGDEAAEEAKSPEYDQNDCNGEKHGTSLSGSGTGA